jgi:two-component system, NtrC family, sensor histidine kinase PilS
VTRRPVQREPAIGDGSGTWLWSLGVVRVFLLCVAALTFLLRGGFPQLYYLLPFYVFGVASGAWCLLSQRRPGEAPALRTWAQVLVDFCVIAATISFTGGPSSLFTFLFVLVILEAGLLLGLVQGFVLAAMASLFMITQILSPFDPEIQPSAPDLYSNVLIQILAYHLTAAISSYWSMRLRRLQQFQRDILDNMNTGFLITDAHGVVSVINKAGARILEMPEEQAASRPVQEVLRVEADSECPVLTALRSQRDFTRYEFNTVVGKDRTKLVGLTSSRLCDGRGRLTGLIASFGDLTEMAEMREELKRQDRMAAVGELAAGLAHEIRNPVAAIRGAMDELHANMEKPDMVDRLAAIAMRESVHLNEIVTGFLDFARNPVMKRNAFDVAELVGEVCDTLEREVPACTNLVVRRELPAQSCRVQGDRTQIRQVFTNLCRNAVEAMDHRNGAVLDITVAPASGSVEIRFEDKGPGIEPDKVARIFEPFYTTRERGAGMGLAICHRIITAHDGTIRAAPRKGGGTSMVVRLPAASTGD